MLAGLPGEQQLTYCSGSTSDEPGGETSKLAGPPWSPSCFNKVETPLTLCTGEVKTSGIGFGLKSTSYRRNGSWGTPLFEPRAELESIPSTAAICRAAPKTYFSTTVRSFLSQPSKTSIPRAI
jgi:hypothetical protein